MKNLLRISLVVVGLVSIACDPYDDVSGGTPNVVAAGAANVIDGVDAVEGTGASNVWTVAGVPCGGITDAANVVQNPNQFDNSYFYVTFDRQIDGALVQSSVTDCTPATGSTLTITPAPSGGNIWYTCYTPSSGTSAEGGSIVVYQAPPGGSEGWADFTYLPSATYHIAGTVAGQTIDVTVTPGAGCT
jgi:hypothetical protein